MRGIIALVWVLVVLGIVGEGTAPAAAKTPAPPTTHSAGWVKAILCIGAVGTFIAGNAVLTLRIKAVGGVVRFAKRLWNAKSAKARWVLIGKVFSGVTGAGALYEACAP